jgi:hypothetical protein
MQLKPNNNLVDKAEQKRLLKRRLAKMLVIKKLIKKKEVRGVSVSVRYYLLKSKGGRGGEGERGNRRVTTRDLVLTHYRVDTPSFFFTNNNNNNNNKVTCNLMKQSCLKTVSFKQS